MKKVIKFFMSVILTLCLSSCNNADKRNEIIFKNEVKNTLNQYIDSLIENTPSYVPSWNQESYKGRWNYIDGVFLNSIINLYKDTKEEKYKNFFLNYINFYISQQGEFINPETYEPNFKTDELDSICASNVLFDAYEMTNDNKYLLAIENTYSYLVQMPKAIGSPNFAHKNIYLNQIWLDGMYMYVPFYVKYANMKNLSYIYREVKAQYQYIREHMFSSSKELYYHGHDTSRSIFWADKSTGNSKSFWLRSMGWYILSLTDSIEYIKDEEVKTYLISLLNEALKGILKYRDEESKMFYQLIDRGYEKFYVESYYFENLNNQAYMVDGQYKDTYMYNYLESSGSSMIAYSLMKSARLKYIDKDFYNTGVECFKGIYKHSISIDDRFHLNDICITAGLGPEYKLYRDGTFAYYLAEPVGSDDAKGIGPFIMSYLEYIK